MKRLSNGLVDRSDWPTLNEIQNYVDGGSGGSFKSRCKFALRELHTVADILDAQVTAGGLGERCGKLEKALSYYAQECRYGERYTDQQHPIKFWSFDAEGWGTAQYHQQPPPYAKDEPWRLAKETLES